MTEFWSFTWWFGHSHSKLCPILCRLHARLCPISFAPCPFPNQAETLGQCTHRVCRRPYLAPLQQSIALRAAHLLRQVGERVTPHSVYSRQTVLARLLLALSTDRQTAWESDSLYTIWVAVDPSWNLMALGGAFVGGNRNLRDAYQSTFHQRMANV